MSIKNMTCIVCPVGCRMKVDIADDGTVSSVEGNSCPRGKKYAISEATNPVRTLTSTVFISGAADKLLPVRTDAPIAKADLFKAMEKIKTVAVSAPVKRGDILAENIAGAKLIACATVDKI